jgi:hypothetical protein
MSKNVGKRINRNDSPNGNPHGEEQKRKITGEIHVRGEVEANIHTNLIEQYKVIRNEKSWRDHVQFTLELLTFAVVSVYAALTYWMAKSTEAQVRLTRDQFIKDQRPYVWITRPQFEPLEDGRYAAGRITFKNLGKSPALHIRNDLSGILIGPNALKEADAFFAGPERSQFIFTGPLAPPLLPENPQDPDSYVSVSPQQLHEVSKSDIEWAKRNDRGEVIVGIVGYRDMAGNSYESEYCIVNYLDGRTSYCPTHNDLR